MNYDTTLWNSLVLQACEHEPSIFLVVIALGSLDASVRRSQSCVKPIYSFQNYCEDKDYQLSRQYYSKAIKQMREAIMAGKHDLRTALIASILIITFQTLHGNHELALTQIRSSIQLLES